MCSEHSHALTKWSRGGGKKQKKKPEQTTKSNPTWTVILFYCNCAFITMLILFKSELPLKKATPWSCLALVKYFHHLAKAGIRGIWQKKKITCWKKNPWQQMTVSQTDRSASEQLQEHQYQHNTGSRNTQSEQSWVPLSAVVLLAQRLRPQPKKVGG